MKEEYVAIIASLIINLKRHNIGGNGIADAQKVLIAAVEEKCVSKHWANLLSKRHELGLEWE